MPSCSASARCVMPISSRSRRAVFPTLIIKDHAFNTWFWEVSEFAQSAKKTHRSRGRRTRPDKVRGISSEAIRRFTFQRFQGLPVCSSQFFASSELVPKLNDFVEEVPVRCARIGGLFGTVISH